MKLEDIRRSSTGLTAKQQVLFDSPHERGSITIGETGSGIVVAKAWEGAAVLWIKIQFYKKKRSTHGGMNGSTVLVHVVVCTVHLNTTETVTLIMCILV